MSASNRESTHSIDSGLTNKFQRAGEFANMPSANNEDGLRMWEGEGTHLNPKFLTSFKFGFLNIYGFYNRAFSIIQHERAKNSSFSFGIRVNMPKLSFPESLAFQLPKCKGNTTVKSTFSHMLTSWKHGSRHLLMSGESENCNVQDMTIFN